jgi:large subunit ribosomal protein L15
MHQHELRQPSGATHKRKRVGRGNASGHGTYSTKGLKGQKARSGGGVRPGFEGGQLPLIRRMARKRGFRNPFRVEYEEVNVGRLSRFAPGDEVDAAALVRKRLLKSVRKPVKVLGGGEVTIKLTVEAARFSRSAQEKIEAAGGSVRWLEEPPAREEATVEEAPAPKARKQKKAKVDEETAAEGSPTGKKPKEKRAPKGEAVQDTDAAGEGDDDAGS